MLTKVAMKVNHKRVSRTQKHEVLILQRLSNTVERILYKFTVLFFPTEKVYKWKLSIKEQGQRHIHVFGTSRVLQVLLRIKNY